MPRNSGGTYSLPSLVNPVVSGTTITSNWANSTLDDVRQALTDSLDRQGRGGMLAPLRLLDGSNALPALSFTNETTTGFYRGGAGNVSLSILATRRFAVDAAGAYSQLGAVGAPSWSFLGDADSGMWSPGADIIAWSTAGVERARISAAGVFSVGTAGVSGDIVSLSDAYGFYPTLRTTVGIAGFNAREPGGARRLEIGYLGSASGGAYGAPADSAVINSAGARTLNFSTADTRRGFFGAAGGLSLISAASVDVLSLGDNSGSAAAAISFDAGSGRATSAFLFRTNARVYSILGGPSNGPGIQARWDSSTANRYLSWGQYDGASVYSEQMRLQEGLFGIGTGVIAHTAKFTIAGAPSSEAIRLVEDNGFISGYNSANSIRSGYLQFIASTRSLVLVSEGASGTISLGTAGAAHQMVLTADGRFYGTSLHNNAGAMTGTANQYIGSGTYTPTTTNVSGFSSMANQRGQWLRVGNVVQVSVFFNADTAAGAAQVDVSLPIASNLSTAGDLVGAGSVSTLYAAQVVGESVGDRARISANPAALVGTAIVATFLYRVL